MHFAQLIQNGGAGAYAALAAGFLGIVIGIVGVVLLAVKSKSANTLAVMAAIVGIAAASLGVLGTLWGKSRVNDALAMVNPLDADRIRIAGYAEAQDASKVGFGAALIPLLLGAAVMLGARMTAKAPGVAPLAGQPREESTAAVSVVSLVLVGIGALVLGGAWVMAHAPLPVGKYPFAIDDGDSWDLAGAIEQVASDPDRGCLRLDEALRAFADPSDTGPAPDTLKREPHASLAGWRAAADACVKRALTGAPSGTGAALSRESLLTSPMLHTDELRALVQAKQDANAPAREAPPDVLESAEGLAEFSPEPPPIASSARGKIGTLEGKLSTQQIRRVIQADVKHMRYCYEKELQRDPKLKGKVVVKFTVLASGQVATATEASPTPFPNAAVKDCILQRFKVLRFPVTDGGPTSIQYPLTFNQAG